MRVGIITFHRAHNCGAALQCVALKMVIERMGHEVQVLDCNDIGDGVCFRKPEYTSLKSWLGAIKRYCLANVNVHRWRYRLFRWKYMNCTSCCIGAARLPVFDRYIVGSDQIFNPEITKDQTRCFLLTGVSEDNRKISYAASFGLDSLPENYRRMFSAELSRFKCLSVRENTGKSICENELHLDKKVSVVIDPTLLLPASAYDPIETPVRVRGKYVLIYWIGGALDATRAIARKVAEQIGAKIVVATLIFASYEPDMMAVSPDQLLWLIRHAEFVVATSFHGTVFSLIYHRSFITVLPRGMKVKSRITDLLGKIGLINRVVLEEDYDKKLGEVDSKINYEIVDRRLECFRSASMEFLQEAMAS